ncbi:MAG: hypothetical protein Q8O67_31430 [Deltaproteobacteria bacterium]|nr:hypothetical protein [Deltaproteobacteria bacterium]
MQVRVSGTPIGGEDAREHAWRAAVAFEAKRLGIANVAAVTLAFTLESGRRVDVDNLARPVLAGLRDAAWFTRGFTSLDRLVVTKTHGEHVGVDIQPAALLPDLGADVDVQILSKNVIPSEGKHEMKRVWREAIRDSWNKPPMEGAVNVELGFRTTRSIVALLKPNIDALEPILGRDPSGRLEFCPLDDKITRLTAWRISGDFALIARVSAARSTLALPSG